MWLHIDSIDIEMVSGAPVLQPPIRFSVQCGVSEVESLGSVEFELHSPVSQPWNPKHDF